MITDGIVSTLQVTHAFFAGVLFLAFVFQGHLGWRLRKKRVAGVLQDFSLVKKHRARGPILATLVSVVYLAGLITVYLHKGLWVRHPGHLAGGTVLLVVVGSVYLASKRIRGTQSPWRTPHFALGLLLLCAFAVQIYLGLNVFL